ncbi:MAG: phosphotransferase family protein [Actinobacteria bacterium]|nr:phosphotransferase family protein [Actinomycetota bacterium]
MSRASTMDILEGMRGWLPQGEQITGIRQLSTGHSNQTFLLEGLGRILRLPPPGDGLLPRHDVAHEHGVLAVVGKESAGPPVPAVFELCVDTSVIGAPFFVMEQVRGSAFEHPQVPQWLVDGPAELRNSICRQWLDAVVASHRIAPTTIAMDPVDPLSDAASWCALARRVSAPKELFALFECLEANPPPPSGPPTLVHGDPHVANCLWDGGQLTALVDWELAMVGDPLSDLGWMAAYFADEPFMPPTAGFDLPGWWSRSRLIEEWEKATGRSAHGVRRYEVLAMAKIATVFASGMHLIATGQSEDPRFHTWAQWLPHYLQLAEYRSTQPDRL